MNADPYRRAAEVSALFDPQLAEPDPCPADLADRVSKFLVTRDVLAEVGEERIRQLHKHGEQVNLPDGTGPQTRWAPRVRLVDRTARFLAGFFRDRCQQRAAEGRVSFLDILLEEVAEAAAEDDPARLRAELLQVAAVAVQWIEAIDARAVTHG